MGDNYVTHSSSWNLIGLLLFMYLFRYLFIYLLFIYFDWKTFDVGTEYLPIGIYYQIVHVGKWGSIYYILNKVYL